MPLFPLMSTGVAVGWLDGTLLGRVLRVGRLLGIELGLVDGIALTVGTSEGATEVDGAGVGGSVGTLLLVHTARSHPPLAPVLEPHL